jgi:hypothetical protein
MRPGGRLGLQNRMRPDVRRVGWVRFPCTPARLGQAILPAMRLTTNVPAIRRAVVLAALVLAAAASPAWAQDPPLPPVPRPVAMPDTAAQPLSPRRAFAYSFLLPGYSQSVLGRHRAAALLVLTEGIAITMIRESVANVREARRLGGDSIVVSFVDGAGQRLTAPQVAPPVFDADFVRTRQRHLEDWVALLIANHLFAGLDAYVAANLWDFPAQLSLRSGGAVHGMVLSANLRW